MKRLATILAAALCACGLGATPAAQAAFGLTDFEVTYTNADGSRLTQAGAHPFALTTSFGLAHTGSGGTAIADGKIRDALLGQVIGLIGDATAVPRCSTVEFLADKVDTQACPLESVVGLQTVAFGSTDFFEPPGPVFNLEPPPGSAARLGWKVRGVPVVVDIGLKQAAEHNLIGAVRGINQTLSIFGSAVELWGVPADPAHDVVRGHGCAANAEVIEGKRFERPTSGPGCSSSGSAKPFLTVPRSCQGAVTTSYEARSWQEPENWVSGSFTDPEGFSGCGKLGYAPAVEVEPTATTAESGSGLDFTLELHDEGIKNPVGLAASDTRKAVVTLPEGVTINPSVGEGLGVCSPAELERETLDSAPGAGCPDASKLGSLSVQSPVITETVEGSIFLAQQDDPATTTPGAENPFDTLIAAYFVIRHPGLGVLVKLPLRVEPDPRSGRLVVILDDAPQVPIGRFSAHLRSGARAPLVTPPACGTYTTETELHPWSDPESPQTVTSSFEITSGVGGGPCPAGGVPAFKPHFEAGSLNNNAGSHTPFNMRLIRKDGEQNMTKFSSILPPGVVGSLVGVGKCPDAAAEAAKAKSGREELASPSCPASSLIGHTLAGAGVGEALTYVGGQIYLAGPYKGAPLSVISITPAVAGPFDAGTVVVRLGLTLNPKTAEVEVDGAASDPIPHILKGIVLKVRDLRVYVDRPNFIVNPTSCDPSSARATLFGSFLNVLDPADDLPADLATRFQAANCLNLGFKPRLGLQLKGGAKRGGHPGLIATYRPRPGDANVEGLVVRLPRSAFLDQAHIRTICTRVQFAADACPPGARYGYIKAFTPLLEEPLEGPVWLRSSNHKLPDLVFDLHGLVDVEVSTRIDSVQGGIRATVESAPDAPLSKVVLRMQGAKKGLIVNSRNLCGAKARAKVQFAGHNGKRHKSTPEMRPDCGGKRKAKGSTAGHERRGPATG